MPRVLRASAAPARGRARRGPGARARWCSVALASSSFRRRPGSRCAAIAPRWLGARNSAITPTSGRRSGDRAQQDHADGGVAQDADDEEVPGLPGRRGDGDRDAHPDQPADGLLHALPTDQPEDEHQDCGAERRPDAGAQPVDGVGDDEGDRRQGGVDHAPPAAELLEHQVPVEASESGAGRAPAAGRLGRRSTHFAMASCSPAARPAPPASVPRCPSVRQPAPSSYQGL